MIAEQIETGTKYYQFTSLLEHMLDCFHTIVSDETNPYHPPLGWLTRKQPRPAHDELFLDLMEECSRSTNNDTSCSSPSSSSYSSSSSSSSSSAAVINTQLSSSVRSRLERYSPEQRSEIVSRTKDGCSPLFIACKNGLTNVAKYLLDTCNAQLEQMGRFEALEDHHIHSVSPLWVASVCCHLETVALLIERGANVNSLSDTGSTPLRSVCFLCQDDDGCSIDYTANDDDYYHHQDDQHFQVDNIIGFEEDDHSQNDSFEVISKFDSDPYVKIVKLLVASGTDVGRANYKGATCLINSLHNYRLTEYILDLGADVNAADNQSKTALHYAIQQGRLELVKLLMSRGADPLLKSSPGDDDALQLSCIAGHVDIFEHLLSENEHRHYYPPERLVDAYRLLGSSILELHYDLGRVRELWKCSLVIQRELQQQQQQQQQQQRQTRQICSSSSSSTNQQTLDLVINYDKQRTKRKPAKCHNDHDDDDDDVVGQVELMMLTRKNDSQLARQQVERFGSKATSLTTNSETKSTSRPSEDFAMEKEEHEECDTRRRRLIAYGDMKEFASELELQALTADQFRIQSLLISERVLGSTHRETIQRLLYRGTSYINSLQPNRCIDLWIYALKLRLKSDSIFHFESIFAAQAISKLFLDLFSQQQQQQQQQQPQHQQQQVVKFSDVRDVLWLLASKLDACTEHLSWKPSSCLHQDIFDLLLSIIVSLLLALKCIAKKGVELEEMQELIGQLVRVNPRTSSGLSLLHICLTPGIFDCEPLRSWPSCHHHHHHNHRPLGGSSSTTCSRPIVKLIGSLIDAGHQIDQPNVDGLSPLQALCLSNAIRSPDRAQVIRMLVERGAHVDRRTLTPEQDELVRLALRAAKVEPFEYISLACLAARQVARHKGHLFADDNQRQMLARHLRESIEIH